MPQNGHVTVLREGLFFVHGRKWEIFKHYLSLKIKFIPKNNFPPNIDLDERLFLSSSSKDVFKTSSRRLDQDRYIFALVIHLQKAFSRLLQDVLMKTNIFVLVICLQDVFKTFSRHLQDVFIMYHQVKLLIDLQDVSTRISEVFKASSKRYGNMSLRYLQDIFKAWLRSIFKTLSKDVFKTSSRYFYNVSSS